MRDCSNAEMRELLPDLLHDRLPADARRQLQEHLDSCADCRGELELLARVRAVVRTPAIDASRIVAALEPHRPRSVWSRAMHAPQLRIAAAIVVVAGSIWALRGPSDSDRLAPNTEPIAQPVVTASPAPTSTSTEVAVGEPLTDLSERDLQALIAELDELDAVMPAEAEVEMPSVQGSE